MKKSTPMFEQVHNAYLIDLKARNLARTYQAAHAHTRRIWMEQHGNQPLADITADHVRAWLNAMQDTLSAGTVRQKYIMLKSFFNWCVAEEYMPRSPMRTTKLPKKPTTLPDVLTEEEALALLRGVKNAPTQNSFRDYTMLLFFLDTGVRVGELASIRLDALNVDGGFCKISGKGRKERLVPLGIELRAALARYLIRYRAAVDGELNLFTSRSGRAMNRNTIQHIVQRHLVHHVKRTLQRGGPHTLRHTFATLYLRRQGDLKRTSLILGHAHTDITERYTHLTGTDVLIDSGGSHMDKLIRKQ